MKKIVAMLLALAMVAGWVAIPPMHAHAEETTQEDNTAVVEPLEPTGAPMAPAASAAAPSGATTASPEPSTEPTAEVVEPTVVWSQYLSFQQNEDGESYYVSGCDTSASGRLTIPQTYNGLPVTAIGDYAFMSCTNLTRVTIPEGVTSLGSFAFGYCENMTSVTIPNSVTTIDSCAFEACSKLLSITISEYVTVIGEFAFLSCGSLTDVTIPNGITTLSKGLFQDCANLAKVTIPGSVTAIEDHVFEDAGLTDVYFAGTEEQWNAVTVGEYNEPLRKATIVFLEEDPTEPEIEWQEYPETSYYYYTTEDGGAVISGLRENIEGYVALPATLGGCPVTGIAKEAFEWRSDLTGVIIPDTVTSIGVWAFGTCTGLDTLILGSGLKTIGQCAFNSCTALTEVTIPASVTSIESAAFYGCTAIKAIHVAGENPAYSSDDFGVLFDKNKTTLIQAPCALSGGYTIPESVVVLANYAFDSCTELTEVTLPAGLTDMGEYAFLGCSSLAEVFIPGTVSELKTSAFANCTSLRNATIAYGVTAIGEYAFAGCEQLENINLPYSTTSIGKYAFSRCMMLTSITVPGSITSLGECIFEECLMLSEVKLQEGVTTIGRSCFKNCYALAEVTIPVSVTQIGDYAFENCDALITVFYADTQEQWDAINISETGNDALLNAEIVQPDACADGHIAEIIPGREPTETEPGLTEGWKCSVCGMILKPQEEIPVISGPTEPTIEPTVAPTEAPIDPTDAPIEPSEPSWPEAGWENGLYFEPNEDGQSYRVSGYNEIIVGELTVPSTYNGLPVTAIGNNALSTQNEMTSVVLPDSITVIDQWAFSNCNNLQSVNLPEGLVAIAEYAFASCDLREIQIPANVSYIGPGAFNACPLTGIWVSENNQEYANDEKGVLFSKDMKLLVAAPYGITGSYAIPDGVDTIGSDAFSNTRLSEVTFPDSVVEIGYYAFQNCCLTEIVIGNGVTGIATDAFANSGYLTSVTIPNSVANFGSGVFQNCPKLTVYCYIGSPAATYAAENKIPIGYLDAVKEVSIATMPDKLIYPLDGLLKLNGLSLNVTLEDGTQVTIHNGYTVGEYDFSTAGTKTVTVSVNGVSVFFEVEVDDQLIEYPESDHPYENNCDITWKFTYPADADMLAITFSEDTQVEMGCDSIYIGDSEGNETYYSGRALAGKKIIVPGKAFTIRLTSDVSQTGYGFSITSIEALKKVDLTALTFTLNENGTGYIVSDCDETAGNILRIPAAYEGLPVVGIGENAFQDCAGLIDVTIEEGITYIGDGAFGYCSELKDITIPVSITAIGDSAFLGCNKLTNVYYNGNRSQWNAIQMSESGEALPNVEIHFSQIGCEHTPGKSVVVNEYGGGNCLDTKYQEVVIYCADCDIEMERKTVDIPATGHTPGEPVIERMYEASCNSSGHYWETTYCTRCNEIVSEVMVSLEPTEHTEGETQVYEQPATCTSKGYREVQTFCAVCNGILKRVTEDIPANGHKPGRTEVENRCEPSCTNDGFYWEIEYCAECEMQLSRTIKILPPTGHINIEERREYECNTSCTNDGVYWNIELCSDCGRTLSAERIVEKATGHTASETTVWNERIADCTNAGYREFGVYCHCGMMLSRGNEFMPALGHTEQIMPGYAATCTDYGLTDGKYCTVCGQITEHQREIPTLPHTEEIIPGYAATCTGEGMSDGKRCAVCGEITQWQGTIPATGHTEQIIPGKAPTVSEPGLTEGKQCAICGEILVAQEEIPCTPAEGTEGYLTFKLTVDKSSLYVYACDKNASGELDIPAEFNGLPVTAIGRNAFQDCTALTAVTIPEGVTILSEYAFANCENLTKVVIPQSVTVIRDRAFYFCSSLSDVAIPSGVTTLGYSVFDNCASLTEITIPEGITAIGRFAFRSTGLTSIVLPASITTVEEYAFARCANLKSLTATANLTSVGKYAFYLCSSLTDVYYDGSSVQWKAITISDYNEPLLKAKVHMDNACADGHTYDHEFDATCNYCDVVRQVKGTYEFVNYRVVFSDSDTTHKNVRVEIYDIGDRTVADPSDDKALKAIDSNPVTRWGAGEINKILITEAGNYVLLLKYNIGTATVRIPIVASVSADPKLIIDKNNKLTVIDNNGANINHRVVVYYLGDKTVDDIYNETALKAIDAAPETVWQKSVINRRALTKGGNYVLHLCYNVGTGAKKTVAQTFTVFSIPTLTVNQNNMLVAAEENAENKNHRVTVFYLGNKTVSDPFNETEVKNAAISSRTIWGLSAINKVEILEGGNYVFHMYYNVGTSTKRTLALEATLTERPKLSVSADNKLIVEYSDASITNPRAYIYNVGDKDVNNIYDEAALQKIAKPTQVWGLGTILRKQLTPGTYVIHLHYNVAGGYKSTVALKITIEA